MQMCTKIEKNHKSWQKFEYARGIISELWFWKPITICRCFYIGQRVCCDPTDISHCHFLCHSEIILHFINFEIEIMGKLRKMSAWSGPEYKKMVIRTRPEYAYENTSANGIRIINMNYFHWFHELKLIFFIKIMWEEHVSILQIIINIYSICSCIFSSHAIVNKQMNVFVSHLFQRRPIS